MDRSRITGTLTGPLEAFLEEWQSDDSDYITAHTSGSTGTPKEIRLLKSDMLLSAESTCRRFGIGPGSVLALPLSVDYIAGKMMVVRALVSGATLYVEEPSSRPFASMPPDFPTIDLAAIVPAQTEGLLASGARVRTLIVGGAPLPPALEQRLAESATDTYATYGMTETCSNVALRRVGSELYEANPGISFATDDRGCLVVESEVMSFRRLVTNDIVRLHGRQTFEWLGRYDNVINTGGVKVFPEAVESKLGRYLQAGTFYVAGRQSERWGTEVVVVCRRDAMPPESLRAEAEASLSRYERPKAWVAVDEIPTTSNGKLLRRTPDRNI